MDRGRGSTRSGAPGWARWLLGVACVVVTACAARPPRNVDDTCAIFDERRGWYRAAKKAQDRWGVPIELQLAIIHQESRFRAKAKPRRKRILWIIPGPRPSTAAGYTQALKSTWKQYVRSSGNRGADRDSFRDAVDFVGWYCARTSAATGVSKADAFRQYLAYHEGPGGFSRGTFRAKPWLVSVARRVDSRAQRYGRQLRSCEERFQPKWWQFWW